MDEPSEIVPVPAVGAEIEAAVTFFRTGSLAAASRATGIALQDLRKLSRTLWWQTELVELRRDSMAQAEAAMTRLHDTTLDAMMDRVQLGELSYDKKGEAVRKPMRSVDLARVAGVVFTQRQLLRNEPTTIPGDTDKLRSLADKLRALGAKDITVIDEESDDAT